MRLHRPASPIDLTRRVPDGRQRTDESAHRARPVELHHLGQLIFLGAVWGAAFLFLRIAAPEVGAVWTAEIRIAIGALILLAIAGRRTWPIARANVKAITIAGAGFSAIPFTLIAVAALTLPVGVGAVLNASMPLFTAGLAIFWLGQRPTGRVILGLVIGIVAVVVLAGWSPLEPGPTTVVAVAAMLGAAFSYAFAGTYVKQRLAGVGGVELATGQLAAGAILLLPIAILSGPPGMPSVAGLVALLAVGTISTALPWPIYLRLLSSTTPTIASTVTFVVPAFAMTWGSIVLGEPIGIELLVGFGIIVVSLVLVLGLGLPAGREPRRRETVTAARSASVIVRPSVRPL
jgi:drug/metabolite transporter (DMT)-like permease